MVCALCVKPVHVLWMLCLLHFPSLAAWIGDRVGRILAEYFGDRIVRKLSFTVFDYFVVIMCVVIFTILIFSDDKVR